MSTNKAPHFPQPSTSTGTVYPTQSAIGTPEQHSMGPAPGSTYPPENPSSRGTANFLPPSNVPLRRPTAHDPPNQPIQVPAHTYTTFQMPQAQDTRMPSTASSPPPGVMQRSGTMQMPDPHNNIRPVPGPYSNYTPQAQGMSHSSSQRGEGMLCGTHNASHGYRNQNGDEYPDDQGHSRQVSHVSSKGPPNRPAAASGEEGKKPGCLGC